MTSSKDSTKWMQLCSLPKPFAQDVINTNPNEFIVIYRLYDLQFFKYSVETDIFSTFVEYGLQSFIRNITFNEKDQILFVHRYQNKHIDSIQILTQEKRSYNYEQELQSVNYFLSIDNHIHIINSHNHHWISSIENNKLNTLHNTMDNVNKPTRNDGAAIYVSSKQCILLIGGYYGDYGDDTCQHANEIWKYCLSSQKWTEMNINGECKRFDFSAVLTSNQRYIILFGGWKYNKQNNIDYRTDDILILDMKDDNNWKIKQSKIKCPDIGNCFVARTGGVDSGHDILVIGFVKKCFKMKEFKHLSIPPFYIISIISKYFSDEMVHYIKNKKHYAIYLKHILSSLYD